MKVLVAVKRTVDPDVRARVKADGSAVDVSSARMSMNPFDAVALEEAVRMKERGLADEVLAVSAGPAGSQETLRLALALGADRALFIETEVVLQPLAVARLLQAVCERESPRLALCGKQAIDDNAAQTGPMLAAMMGWPQAAFASEIFIDPGDGNGRAMVAREVDEGIETVEITLPAVITTGLRLNSPRFASLMDSVRARKKPLETLTPEALGVDAAPRLETLEVLEPPPRAPGVRVKSAADLARFLRERGAA
ncbi:MAG: electron transfer flavoprotein subunit beta/FixA family protein [Candidatus Accumulibacter sp.]|jgi:electron transfer flavoprotein beta subunit|nr:electron transfer flavoprotein subunit beta/FixA family protein [Accumulibacter sp.]